MNRARYTEDERRRRIAGLPVRRLGEPEDVARAVVFLAADESSVITGQVLSPNGGDVI